MRPAASRRPWLRRWCVDPVAAQLTQGITAEKIALSLAVGSLCAFFPVLGAATPLCVLAAVALRLNQPVIQLVNAVTAPLYPIVVLGLMRLGDGLLGPAARGFDPRAMVLLLPRDPALCLRVFGPLIGHALLGWALLAPAWIAAGYVLLLPLVRRGAACWLRAPVRRS
jgi:uncharacterized protein (DUF2062 family)